MPMTATSWTISCDTDTCSRSPWPKSTPLTVKGDQKQAMAAAEKAGWRRCWSRDPKTGERRIMRPRNPGWWCPWHVRWVLNGEAERDRTDAEFADVLERAKRQASNPEPASH